MINILIIIITVSAYLTGYVLFCTDRLEYASNNANYILYRIIKNDKIKKSQKNILKVERKLKNETKYQQTLYRVGIRMPASEYQKLMFTKILIFVVLGVIPIVHVLIVQDINKLTKVVNILVGLVFLVFLPFKEITKVNRLKNTLKLDSLRDLKRFVSLYKNAPRRLTIVDLFQIFIPNANALKYDLNIFLSEFNFLSRDSSLDNLAERVDIPEMLDLVRLIKTSDNSRESIFDSNVSIFEEELKKSLIEAEYKSRKSKIGLMTALMVITFMATILLMFAGNVAEILSASDLF